MYQFFTRAIVLTLLSFSAFSLIAKPIAIHYIVAASDTEGTNAKVTPYQMNKAIENLNQHFANAKVLFEFHSVTYLSNEQVVGFASDDWNTDDEEDLRPYFKYGQFNVVVADLYDKNGHAYWNYEATDVIEVDPEDLTTSTLAHEIGHNFGLLHTYQSIDDGTVTTLEGPEGWRYGDNVLDTPVDPGERDYFNDCVYIGTATDSAGTVYQPDGFNFMGKGDNDCRTRFSTQQIRRIHRVLYTDKFHLTQAYGEGQNPTCSNSPVVSQFPHSEGFNNNQLVRQPSWVQDSFNDDFNWKYDYDTLTSKTGATEPFEGQSFLHVDAGHELLLGRAVVGLLSPCFELPVASQGRFIFYYNMYGVDIGELLLSVSTDNGESWSPLWRKQGQQQSSGANWQKANVELTDVGQQSFQLKLEAYTYGGSKGDISLDNFHLIIDDIEPDTTAAKLDMPTIKVDEASKTVTSDMFTISDVNRSVELSIIGGEVALSCDDSAFTSEPMDVVSGQSFCVRHQSPSEEGKSNTSFVTLGADTYLFRSSYEPTPVQVKEPTAVVEDSSGSGGGSLSFSWLALLLGYRLMSEEIKRSLRLLRLSLSLR